MPELPQLPQSNPQKNFFKEFLGRLFRRFAGEGGKRVAHITTPNDGASNLTKLFEMSKVSKPEAGEQTPAHLQFAGDQLNLNPTGESDLEALGKKKRMDINQASRVQKVHQDGAAVSQTMGTQRFDSEPKPFGAAV